MLNGFPIQMQARSGNDIENLVGTITVNDRLKAYLERGSEFSLHPSLRGLDKKELVGLYLQPLPAVSVEEYDRGYKDGYAKGLEASEKVAALEEEVARLNQLLSPTSDVSEFVTTGANGRGQELISEFEKKQLSERYLPKDV